MSGVVEKWRKILKSYKEYRALKKALSAHRQEVLTRLAGVAGASSATMTAVETAVRAKEAEVEEDRKRMVALQQRLSQAHHQGLKMMMQESTTHVAKETVRAKGLAEAAAAVGVSAAGLQEQMQAVERMATTGKIDWENPFVQNVLMDLEKNKSQQVDGDADEHDHDRDKDMMDLLLHDNNNNADDDDDDRDDEHGKDGKDVAERTK